MTVLDGWENFYVIVGSSAGALIGLQFVFITLFARAGHEVVFSYARSKEKLKKLARDAKGNTTKPSLVYSIRWTLALYGSPDTPSPLRCSSPSSHMGGEGGPELAYRFELFGKR